jgi:hypothetical protein
MGMIGLGGSCGLRSRRVYKASALQALLRLQAWIGWSLCFRVVSLGLMGCCGRVQPGLGEVSLLS